jgi:hypothetical protein
MELMKDNGTLAELFRVPMFYVPWWQGELTRRSVVIKYD